MSASVTQLVSTSPLLTLVRTRPTNHLYVWSELVEETLVWLLVETVIVIRILRMDVTSIMELVYFCFVYSRNSFKILSTKSNLINVIYSKCKFLISRHFLSFENFLVTWIKFLRYSSESLCSKFILSLYIMALRRNKLWIKDISDHQNKNQHVKARSKWFHIT